MKFLRYWKIVLSLLLVFLAGGVVGGVLTHQAIKRALEKSFKFETWSAGTVHVLQKELNLTPGQREKITVIADDMAQELKETFSKSLDQSGHIIVKTSKRIDQELTPEQRAIHAEMKRKLRASLKKDFNIVLPEE